MGRVVGSAASMEVPRKQLSVGKIRAAELPIVWVLGGPGSGKGSQCEILAYKRNFKHISGGDLLRHEVMSGSEFGRQLYKLMEMGELVPTTVVLDQAAAFEAFIGPPAKVIYLSLAQDVMVSRLLERGNFDDKEEAISRRCATFQNECRSVLEKYAGSLVKVDAGQDKEAVAAEIEAA